MTDRRAAVLLFLGCFLVYHANGRPHPEIDCVAEPYVAWSLLQHGSLDLSGYPECVRLSGTIHVQRTSDGRLLSGRPPGVALTALPFLAPLAVFRADPPAPLAMILLGKLIGALMTSGASAIFYLLCRRLAPASAPAATTLFALGSCLWTVASQALWMHGPATLWVTLGLSLLLPTELPVSRRRLAVAGLVLGLAVLTRPTTAFFVMGTGLVFLGRGRWRELLTFALGGMPPLLVLLATNYSCYGHPLLGGYCNDYWDGAPPLWLGLGGLLIAPSRGLLTYSPALVLAPVGLWQLRRLGERGALLAAWTAAALLTVLFYSRWYDWRGGWCYGPRFLCETLPIFCLLFALAYAALRHAWQRRGAELLVAASVSVHLLGIAGYSAHEDWNKRHDLRDQGRSLFSLRDTQIEAHSRAAVAKAGRILGVR
jgi:hypothetical protein